MKEISYEDFKKIELRVGTILEVLDFFEARKAAYKLRIDFGKEIGIKWSSSQITDHYTKEELVGKQVMCVVNFAPKKVGPFTSEVLTTGFYRENGTVVLAVPDKDVPNGASQE